MVVDDFESYNDIPISEFGGNPIYMTWITLPLLSNGGSMGYVVSPDDESKSTMEIDIVHSGNQSAPMPYNNTVAFLFSEVVRTFTPAQDWTANGATLLSLWFYGDPANTTGQMYLMIDGVRIDYDGDLGNMRRSQWHRWTVDLTKVGTDLQRVSKFAIGIDGSDARGLLLLDDIELYATAPTQ
jgi:hypothetical protein